MRNLLKSTGVHVQAGCFVCAGSDAMWTAPNAMAVAVRHATATGHETWADQVLAVRWRCDAQEVAS